MQEELWNYLDCTCHFDCICRIVCQRKVCSRLNLHFCNWIGSLICSPLIVLTEVYLFIINATQKFGSPYYL